MKNNRKLKAEKQKISEAEHTAKPDNKLSNKRVHRRLTRTDAVINKISGTTKLFLVQLASVVFLVAAILELMLEEFGKIFT